MLWLSILLACTDDFKNADQNVEPIDTAELNDDTGTEDTNNDDTGDTTSDTNQDTGDTGTEEPVEDYDGDGWTVADGDCDDDDANINPSVPDNSNDGIDQNCDGVPDDGWVDPQDQDQDGDGWTPAEGDCLDTPGTGEEFNPDAADDECDGLDQNCNGTVDDGFSDPNEPNDSWTFGDFTALNYLGRLDEDDYLIEFENYHSATSDVDTFVFFSDDGFGWDFDFTINLWDVPATLDLAMSVEGFDEQGVSMGVVATATSNGPGTDLELTYEGGTTGSDTGYYVLTITGIGSECSIPYQIKIEDT